MQVHLSNSHQPLSLDSHLAHITVAVNSLYYGVGVIPRQIEVAFHGGLPAILEDHPFLLVVNVYNLCWTVLLVPVVLGVEGCEFAQVEDMVD